MEKYTIVHKPDDLSEEMAKKLDASLKANGRIQNDASPDIVFVVGGDGTFLYAVHHYINMLDKVKFYGIHTGTLGFFTDYSEEEFDLFLEQYLKDELHEITYPLLEVSTEKETYYALNEMRIENAAVTQVLKVMINDQYFEDFRGSGMCISTQLGSTAYNRSLGGAVIAEGIDLMEMTEIAGIHHNKYRSLGAPIVMPSNTKVELISETFCGAVLGIDSKIYPLDDINKVTVQACLDKKVRMLRGREISYFKRLKSLF